MWYRKALDETRYQSTYLGGDGDEIVGDEEEDVDPYVLGPDADQLASNSGIHIYRDRSISQVIRDEAGNVVGALWTAQSPDAFTFDVVVDPNHRREGIATQLVHEAVLEYQSIASDFPEMRLYAQVVSPEMRELLSQKFGWHVVSETGSGLLMEP